MVCDAFIAPLTRSEYHSRTSNGTLTGGEAIARHDQDLQELGLHPSIPSPGDWAPTPHGRFLAGVLHERPELYADADVLELGAGTALHTVLLERGGARSITATEYDERLLATTRHNLEAHGAGERVRLIAADWLDVPGDYDLIVSNPPFCKSGKRNRRYFIDELILNAHKCLRPEGRLLFIQSSMADIPKTLRRLVENGFVPEIVDETRGPFRAYYYDEPGFLEEAARVPDGFTTEDGTDFEHLAVIHASLADD